MLVLLLFKVNHLNILRMKMLKHWCFFFPLRVWVHVFAQHPMRAGVTQHADPTMWINAMRVTSYDLQGNINSLYFFDIIVSSLSHGCAYYRLHICTNVFKFFMYDNFFQTYLGEPGFYLVHWLWLCISMCFLWKHASSDGNNRGD